MVKVSGVADAHFLDIIRRQGGQGYLGVLDGSLPVFGGNNYLLDTGSRTLCVLSQSNGGKCGDY